MGVGNSVNENVVHSTNTREKRLQTPNRYVGKGARGNPHVVRQDYLKQFGLFSEAVKVPEKAQFNRTGGAGKVDIPNTVS